jgi:DNA-binding cell septation regulator SpoVG
MPRGRPSSTPAPEVPREEERQVPVTEQGTAAVSEPAPDVQESAPAETVLEETQEEAAPAMNVAQYMEYFQLDCFPQEMVDDFVRQVVEDAYPQITEQRRNESPLEPTIPLTVQIKSLELEGDTRAFATAQYGDLTIDRIRIKEDEYGSLSVSMSKVKADGVWRETCRFNTAESRNRLTGAVLEAYEQTLSQMQRQGEAPEQDEQEQGGPVMGMAQSQ